MGSIAANLMRILPEAGVRTSLRLRDRPKAIVRISRSQEKEGDPGFDHKVRLALPACFTMSCWRSRAREIWWNRALVNQDCRTDFGMDRETFREDRLVQRRRRRPKPSMPESNSIAEAGSGTSVTAVVSKLSRAVPS